MTKAELIAALMALDMPDDAEVLVSCEDRDMWAITLVARVDEDGPDYPAFGYIEYKPV